MSSFLEYVEGVILDAFRDYIRDIGQKMCGVLFFFPNALIGCVSRREI